MHVHNYVRKYVKKRNSTRWYQNYVNRINEFNDTENGKHTNQTNQSAIDNESLTKR